MRSIRPLDVETIVRSVQKTNRLITVEEGYIQSGVGAEISAQVTENAFDFLDAPVERVASSDVPMPYARNLEDYAMVHPEQIVSSVHRLLNVKF